MANKRLTITGYGQIELNNVAFRRDGRIEAQCKPDTTDFATAKIENGMLLAVDKANGTVKFATGGDLPIGLVYTTEHMYDERHVGLNNFYLNGTDDFLPRIGYLATGDTFHTNCISYKEGSGTGEYATEAAFITALQAYKTTPLYGGWSADGSIVVSTSAVGTGPKLKVAGWGTMPDGTPGAKFQVITA